MTFLVGFRLWRSMVDPHHAKDDPQWNEEGDVHVVRVEVPQPQFTYAATIKRVIDGDTIRIDLDLGAGTWLRNRDVRLSGLDTPEARGSEAPAGRWVTDRVVEWIGGQRTCVVHSKVYETGKWGRWLAEIWVGSHSLNQWLLSKGYAWPTDRGGAIIGGIRDIDMLQIPDEIKQQLKVGHA